jgi:hypothetical protein
MLQEQTNRSITQKNLIQVAVTDVKYFLTLSSNVSKSLVILLIPQPIFSDLQSSETHQLFPLNSFLLNNQAVFNVSLVAANV